MPFINEKSEFVEVMCWLVGILLFIGIITYATADDSEPVKTCYTASGYEYIVPEKRKLVEVPWWWKVQNIQHHQGGVKPAVSKPPVVEDCLVFGPGGTCND